MQGPGALNNVVANTVIVEGPNDGVFVYSGAPALGNLITSISAVATTDQFGNTVFQGTTNIKFSAGVYYATNMGINNTLSFLTATSQAGPWTNNGGIGQSPNSLEAITSLFQTSADAVINGALTATSGIPLSPTVIETDVWNPVTPPTGFSGLLRYRMRAEKDVEVEAQLAVTPTAPTGTVVLIVLPTLYVPTTLQHGPCGIFLNGTPNSLAAMQGIMDLRWAANISPTSTFSLQAFPGGAAGTGITECSFNIRYALD